MIFVYLQSTSRNFQVYFQSWSMSKALFFSAYFNLGKHLEKCQHVEIFDLKTFILLIFPKCCTTSMSTKNLIFVGTKGWLKDCFPLDKPIDALKQHKVHGIIGKIMTKRPLLLSTPMNPFGLLYFLPLVFWLYSFGLLAPQPCSVTSLYCAFVWLTLCPIILVVRWFVVYTLACNKPL